MIMNSIIKNEIDLINYNMQWIYGSRVCNAWEFFNEVRCL